MAAAGRLRSPLRAATLKTLIGLLAVSGIRVGEVLRLDSGDLHAEPGALALRNSKAGKSRMVPLSASTVSALETYSARRDELCPRRQAGSPGDPKLEAGPAGALTVR